MKTSELHYELPGALIAQTPADSRAQSRLLVMRKGTPQVSNKTFSDIIDYINPGDCLVVNNTKVICARFFAKRKTGAQLEGLFLEETTPGKWIVMLKNARRISEGETISLLDRNKQEHFDITALQKLEEGRWILETNPETNAEELLSKIGYAPLPPYIKRPNGGDDVQTDIKRYQTVYAQTTGAVAAPTAGLHFTNELIDKLKEKGVRFAYVTLHVGAGTFKPITVDDLNDHDIHSEWFSIDAENAAIINETQKNGGRIIAVGTTSVRTLESATEAGKLLAKQGDTKLFIQPGYEYKIVDAMITNFHLPQSTLIALVAAFTGLDNIMAAYRHAVENKYRFYSYGDAMFIH